VAKSNMWPTGLNSLGLNRLAPAERGRKGVRKVTKT